MPPPAEGLAPRLIVGPTLRTQPDRRLVTLVREGYEQAFEEIVRRYGRPLGRYAASIVGGRSEDVTQDAFSKALLALRRNDAEIELRPWLFRIVRNTALNDLRDRPPTSELAETVPASGGPAEQAEQREELAELTRRLQALPEPQRAAIVMRELEGLGHDEIAAALGLSGGAARQAIYRARAALRDGLGLLIPFPLVKALLSEDIAHHAEIATGAMGGAGAGVGLKATAATLLVAGTVGAGVVLHDNPGAGDSAATARATREHRPLAGMAGSASRAGAENHGRIALSGTGQERSRRGAQAHGAPVLGATGQTRGSADSGGPTSEQSHSGSSEHDGSGSDGHSPSVGEHTGSGDSGSGSSGSGESGSESGSGTSGDSSGTSGDSSTGSGDGSGSGELSSPDGGSDGGSTETTESSSGSSGSTTDGFSGDSRDSSGSGGLIQEMSPLD